MPPTGSVCSAASRSTGQLLGYTSSSTNRGSYPWWASAPGTHEVHWEVRSNGGFLAADGGGGADDVAVWGSALVGGALMHKHSRGGHTAQSSDEAGALMVRSRRFRGRGIHAGADEVGRNLQRRRRRLRHCVFVKVLASGGKGAHSSVPP